MYPDKIIVKKVVSRKRRPYYRSCINSQFNLGTNGTITTTTIGNATTTTARAGRLATRTEEVTKAGLFS
jgi:hypothetical protein